MTAMNRKCLLTHGICAYIAFFAVPIQYTVAETISEAEVRVIAKKIQKNYNQCVFTVNSFTRLTPEYSVPQVKNKKYVKWCRNVGTAIPIDDQGHLITLHRVVENAEKVEVITSTGKKVNAHVLGCDDTGHISVLQIEDYSKRSIIPKITSLNNIHPGNEVFFLGVVPGMSIAVNSGLIGNIRLHDGIFEVNTDCNPGTSGTPVFDKDENILGFLAFQIDKNNHTTPGETYENTFLVISSEYASVLARHIINNSNAQCGWLGLYIDPISSVKDGVIIKNVVKGSPANKSGLQPLDKIIEFNNIPISTLLQLCEAFSNKRSGETVSLKILRADRLLSFRVTLIERPDRNNKK